MLRPASPDPAAPRGRTPSRDVTRPVVVVGAGLAGAACAAAIARRGRSVVLLESERVPGRHSSGRNAGLLRQGIEDPVLARLAREGAVMIAARESRVPRRATGSILIDPTSTIPASVRRAIEARPIDPDTIARRMPWLEGAALEGAFETPGDAIVEVHALLASILEDVRAAGGEVRFGERALRPRLEGGSVVGVDTDRGEIELSDLVIATGAWGGAWGERAGVPIALTPTRRSLVLTALPFPVPDVPWVWHLEEGWYLRPESGGMLWCAGEEHRDEPREAAPDPRAPDRLAEVVTAQLPAVTGWTPRRHWAGHRSFLPDRRFLLGPDPRLAHWHWAVGLGGHGMTTCLAVGERVAQALVDEDPTAIEPELAFRDSALVGVLRTFGEPRVCAPDERVCALGDRDREGGAR